MNDPAEPSAPRRAQLRAWIARGRQLSRLGWRAVQLVFRVHPWLTLALFALALVSGLLPAAVAFVAKKIVENVVQVFLHGDAQSERAVVYWVLAEFGLVALQRGVERSRWLSDSLLRTQLAQRLNEQILEKALALELPDFEDPAIADRMTRARRGASYRPLALVLGVFDFGRNAIGMLAYGVLLFEVAPYALLLVVAAAVPLFVVETRFSEHSFRVFRWRAPETRQQNYLEAVIAREDHAKEVKLFALGPLFLARYRAIFEAHYREDRAGTTRQAIYGYLLGLLSDLAFYGSYAWIAFQTARGEVSFGDMTMFLLVFRQAQGALHAVLSEVRGNYENLLYVADLFEFLDTPPSGGSVGTALAGPKPGDGLRFENVTFVYPGAKEPTLRGIDLHLAAGHKLALVGENGAGKTTLIKLLTGLYRPTEGRVLLDGLDLRQWDPLALRRRIGVIFQDFVHYQLVVGENIGVGDVDAIDDEERWQSAAKKGLADAMIEGLPAGYKTQLGKWFDDGRELSGGQWQKIALARGFMREHADILVLDEPTASMDAAAEMRIFERFRALTEDRMAILISHRFSTVRMADTIAVVHEGRVVEHGSHDELLASGGRYAQLFLMQAKGYR